MGHKAHPLALRLASGTRRQDMHVYSRRYRDMVALQYSSLYTYLRTIGESMGYAHPRIAYQSGHRGMYIYPFYCTKEETHSLGVQCRVSEPRRALPVGTQSIWCYAPPLSWTTLLSLPHVYPPLPSLSPGSLVQWAMSHTPPHTRVEQRDDMCVGLGGDALTPPVLYSRDTWLHTHIATTMEGAYGTPVHYMPIIVQSMWKNAGYLADAIVWCMEHRVRFAMLKRVCTQQVQTMPDILGVRIACAGRVGGRSKKSQRARRDVWKYGATPLHVYGREIDYAQRTAQTPLGSMGVSVWVYRRHTAQ